MGIYDWLWGGASESNIPESNLGQAFRFGQQPKFTNNKSGLIFKLTVTF
jgi:hypothetical protein